MASVWNVGKVFSNLVLGSSSSGGAGGAGGRHASVPPELPSSVQSRLSLKKVFKKRSV